MKRQYRAPLTDGEKRIYKFILDFIRKNKYPPTMREISEFFGYKSTNSVVTKINQLKLKGYVTNQSHKDHSTARTIQLVDDIIGYYIVNTEELSAALAKLKERGHQISARDAVELLCALRIKIE